MSICEFLGLKLASRGDYYWHKGLHPQAQVSYVLAHQLYPSSRAIFEILAGQIMAEARQYPGSTVRRQYSIKHKTGINSSSSVPERKGSS